MCGLQIMPWYMSHQEGTYIKSVLVYNWIEVLVPVVPRTSQISECYRHTGLKHPHQLLIPTRMEEWVNTRTKQQLENITFTCFQSKQWSILLASRTSTESIFFLSKLPLPTKLKAFTPLISDRSLTISTADKQFY